jgi:predicted ArsR family transcriptional regulator
MLALDFLQSDTKRRLLRLMKRRGEITLNDAVEAIDRARPTLRDHLDQMGRDGLVARRTKKQGRGRPSMCYRMTPSAEQLFPRGERPVFAEFLDYLQEQGHDHLIEAFFTAFWDARLKEVKHRLDGSLEDADVRDVVRILEGVLQEGGFMPEVRVEEEQITVTECNCPFAQIIDTTDLPCASEACFYDALFERVERTGHMADGDTSCVYELSIVESNSA